METTDKHLTVAYRMYAINDAGERELLEEADAEHPFQFISGYGTVLDRFEQAVAATATGESFDVEIPAEEAYGAFDPDHVLELSIDIFKPDGFFDATQFAAGTTVRLNTSDGRVVNALIEEVNEADGIVVVNLNHPLAGRTIAFAGTVIANRDATPDEVQGLMNMFNHRGCGCGCGCGCECGDGGCGSSCGDGDCGEHKHSCGCC